MTRWRAALRAAVWRWRATRSGGRISIGPGCRMEARLDIQGPGSVAIGEGVTIGGIPGERRAIVTIYTHAPDARVTIGDRTRLLGARIGSKFEVRIGRDVLVEEASIADTDFHSVAPDRGVPPHESLESCRLVIDDEVAIGARSIVTKGVQLGHGATVLPGSVVVRSVPPGAMVQGNPARVTGGVTR